MDAVRGLMLSPMGVIEFELERTIKAPIEDVFARLADINGHKEWMPKKGSILRHTHQTSPGEPTLRTRFLDETVYGPTPGEIVEFHAPHTLVYHWWDGSKSGKLKAEGWPGYSLESADDNTTLVRHRHPQARALPRRRISPEGPVPDRPRKMPQPGQPHPLEQRLEEHPQRPDHDLRRPPAVRLADGSFKENPTDPVPGITGASMQSTARDERTDLVRGQSHTWCRRPESST